MLSESKVEGKFAKHKYVMEHGRLICIDCKVNCVIKLVNGGQCDEQFVLLVLLVQLKYSGQEQKESMGCF